MTRITTTRNIGDFFSLVGFPEDRWTAQSEKRRKNEHKRDGTASRNQVGGTYVEGGGAEVRLDR